MADQQVKLKAMKNGRARLPGGGRSRARRAMAVLVTMVLSGNAWQNRRTVSSRRDRGDGRRWCRELCYGI